jgi:integrase
MSSLAQHLEEYLRVRRALGYKLERHGQILPDLITYLQEHGSSTITSELAIAWARSTTGACTRHWANRLGACRGFAAYLQTIDPTNEIPPAGVFAGGYRRPAPYLWSQQDIGRLLDAARTLRPALKAATCEALFGLLGVTGMRVGEAVALERNDVDLAAGVITIAEQAAKLERARLIPVHPTTITALERYLQTRDRLCPRPRSTRFFLSPRGGAWDRNQVTKTLRQITIALGLRTRTVHPRTHDLRHSFAVRILADAQQAGIPVDERIAVLATYLGHKAPSDTYWYLSTTPELMGLAAQRLDQRFGAQS